MNSKAPLSIEITACEQLAQALEQRFGVARAVPVGRAALGLMIVLECWRQRRRVCRVALPGAICQEVVVAVLAAGCEPVFCDVDPSDGLVRDSEWARARSLGANVALVVHLYGNPALTGAVRAAFPAPDCLVIDDAAQALGSFTEGGAAGTVGDVGLLSFGPTKQISIGNAALLFKDRTFAEATADALGRVAPQPQAKKDAIVADFRIRLGGARTRLHSAGDRAAEGFSGLLDGMQSILHVPLSSQRAAATVQALASYADAARDPTSKNALSPH